MFDRPSNKGDDDPHFFEPFWCRKSCRLTWIPHPPPRWEPFLLTKWKIPSFKILDINQPEMDYTMKIIYIYDNYVYIYNMCMNMEHVGSFKGQGINLGPFEAKMLSESGETKESKEAKETAELLDSAFSDHLKLNFWWLFRQYNQFEWIDYFKFLENKKDSPLLVFGKRLTDHL